MKRIKLIICLLSILISAKFTIAQSQEQEITKRIDSLTRIAESNSSRIDTLKIQNKAIENNINELRNELHKIQMQNQIGTIAICVQGTLLYEQEIGLKSLARISTGEKVKIIEVRNSYFKVLYNGLTGYVIKSGFKNEEEFAEDIKKKAEYEEKRLAEENEKNKIKKENEIIAEKAEEDRKKGLQKKFGVVNGTKIYDGKIWIGMSEQMVIESWGKPNEINRTVGSWGVHEQWIYPGKQYLYIENGKLTSWQD